MTGPNEGDRHPATSVTDVRRATWNGAMVEELRAMQEPGDPDFVAELLETFRGEADMLFARLTERAQNRDLAQVREIAHRIKGGALNLGADRLSRAASLLESAARRGEASAIDALVEDLIAERVRFFDRADRC